ncbi:MAG: cytochrome c biogenesis protein CcsA [Leptonema sp. (in: bacteria)]
MKPQFTTFIIIGFIFTIIPVTLLGLVYPPVIPSQGVAHRIFYMHVPIAWVGMYAPFLGSLFGILFILTKKTIYEKLIYTSMNLAFLFSLGVIISGPIWASTEWGTYWNWKDSRLMSFFILLLALGSYFIVKNFTDDPQKKAIYSAIMAILSSLASLLTWFSIRIFTPDTHPTPVLSTMSPKIRLTFWISIIGYNLFFISFFYLTYRYEKIKEYYEKILYYEEK